MADTHYIDRLSPIEINRAIDQILLRHVRYFMSGRLYLSDITLYYDVNTSDNNVLLNETLSHIARQAMCDNNERGRCYCTNFHEVLKPRLALIIPQGIRAPPGSLYLPEDNAPTGAFCIYRGQIMPKC